MACTRKFRETALPESCLLASNIVTLTYKNPKITKTLSFSYNNIENLLYLFYNFQIKFQNQTIAYCACTIRHTERETNFLVSTRNDLINKLQPLRFAVNSFRLWRIPTISPPKIATAAELAGNRTPVNATLTRLKLSPNDGGGATIEFHELCSNMACTLNIHELSLSKKDELEKSGICLMDWILSPPHGAISIKFEHQKKLFLQICIDWRV